MSCIPGAKSTDHEVTDAVDKDKLCTQCVRSKLQTSMFFNNLDLIYILCNITSYQYLFVFVVAYQNCNADDTNLYYGNEGALQCLSEGGEFAVITKQG